MLLIFATKMDAMWMLMKHRQNMHTIAVASGPNEAA